MVLTSNLFTFDHAARFKISNNPLDGSLGDSHLKCNFPKHDRRISGEKHEDVRMVRQEGPLQMGRHFQLSFCFPGNGLKRLSSGGVHGQSRFC